jgi:5-methylcytosine-specific restriction endonuclease McrA
MKISNCKNCGKEIKYNPSQKHGIWCSNKCQGEHAILKRFVKGSKWSQTMRRYLVENKDYHCEECGITEHNGKPITLEVDHIDGDRENNTFENLRFICPNCHSQTETWRTRNMSDAGRERCRTNVK